MRLLLALAFAAALRLESPGIAVLAALVNQSIDDTDPSIVYLPSKFWHASTLPCETCLNPPNASAFLKTWHDGTHIIPNADEDDEGASGPDTDGDTPSGSGSSSSSSRSSSSTHSTSSSTVVKSTSLPTTPSPAATTAAAAGTDTDDDDDGHKGKGDHPDRRRRRGPLAIRDGGNPFEVPTDDSDDPGFQDVNATMTLNFTGSAIYLYALLPLYASPANTTPTFVNLSFALDNTSLPNLHYIHTGTALPSSLTSLFATTPLTNTGQPGDPLLNPALPKNNATFFQYSALVFSMTRLDNEDGQDAPHSLTVNVGPNSVFLFDYALVTTTEANSTSGSNTTTAAQGVASSSDPMKKHNVATFAGAVGGSAGFLAILAFGLALSIYVRRRRSAKRDQQQLLQNSGSSQLMGEYAGGGNGNAFVVSYAERFSAVDHGADEAAPGTADGMGEGMGPGRLDQEVPDYDEHSGRRRTRGARANSNAPLLMAQAQPAPFVPRYFPGTVPASPPPYPVASREGTPLMQAQSQLGLGLPPPPPPPPPMQSQLPPPLLSYSAVVPSRDLTYADLPPPTPPGGFEDELYGMDEEVPVLGLPMRLGAATAAVPSDTANSPSSPTRTSPVLGLILAAATANSASSQAASPVLSSMSSTSGNRGVTTAFGHMTDVNSRAASLRSIGSISSLAGRGVDGAVVVVDRGGNRLSTSGSEGGVGTSDVGDGSGGSTSGSAADESQGSRTPLIRAGNSSSSMAPAQASTPTLTSNALKRKPPPTFIPNDDNDNHTRSLSTTSLPIVSINSSNSALESQLQSRASTTSLTPTPQSEQSVVHDDYSPPTSTESLSPSNSQPSTLTPPHQATSSQAPPPPLPTRSELRRSGSGPRSGHQQ